MKTPAFGFTREYNIRFYDCDYNGNIKVSAVLRMLADIAELDYDKKGYGHDLLWERRMVFLLSGESIRFHRRPKGNETLTLFTWERQIKGARYYRSFEASDASGAPVFSADSVWLLADPETRRILRPDSYDFHPDLHPERTPDVLPVEKLARGEEGVSIGERPVRFTDLDNNRHVYNAVYADMAFDALPFELASGPVRDFRINFTSEALPGDILSLVLCGGEGEPVVRGLKPDGSVCFECGLKR